MCTLLPPSVPESPNKFKVSIFRRLYPKLDRLRFRVRALVKNDVMNKGVKKNQQLSNFPFVSTNTFVNFLYYESQHSLMTS